MVKTRTELINHVHGIVKTNGDRLSNCSTSSFAKRCRPLIPMTLMPALDPVFDTIAQVSLKIREMDSKIIQMCQQQYPEAERLQQVPGVGPVTALAYVLTLEKFKRFNKSRQVGPFVGLTPRRDQSGEADKQLPITKAGNKYLRQLLVGSAHYIIGPFGPDSRLRRHGLSIAARGGKNARKRATVTVAHKLAVLLHQLWSSGQKYEPFFAMDQQKAA